MTPDVIAEAKLVRQLKGKKATIKFLLNDDNVSEPLKSTLKKAKRGAAKPNKKRA